MAAWVHNIFLAPGLGPPWGSWAPWDKFPFLLKEAQVGLNQKHLGQEEEVEVLLQGGRKEKFPSVRTPKALRDQTEYNREHNLPSCPPDWGPTGAEHVILHLPQNLALRGARLREEEEVGCRTVCSPSNVYIGVFSVWDTMIQKEYKEDSPTLPSWADSLAGDERTDRKFKGKVPGGSLAPSLPFTNCAASGSHSNSLASNILIHKMWG